MCLYLAVLLEYNFLRIHDKINIYIDRNIHVKMNKIHTKNLNNDIMTWYDK